MYYDNFHPKVYTSGDFFQKRLAEFAFQLKQQLTRMLYEKAATGPFLEFGI